mmetsp:Transcript_94970/g.245305  ORF Transcript_94970/g.245305 Transcript_94970/m.245305 type:complete len:425 (+) Transcript_94970:260-1534(+)
MALLCAKAFSSHSRSERPPTSAQPPAPRERSRLRVALKPPDALEPPVALKPPLASGTGNESLALPRLSLAHHSALCSSKRNAWMRPSHGDAAAALWGSVANCKTRSRRSSPYACTACALGSAGFCAALCTTSMMRLRVLVSCSTTSLGSSSMRRQRSVNSSCTIMSASSFLLKTSWMRVGTWEADSSGSHSWSIHSTPAKMTVSRSASSSTKPGTSSLSIIERRPASQSSGQATSGLATSRAERTPTTSTSKSGRGASRHDEMSRSSSWSHASLRWSPLMQGTSRITSSTLMHTALCDTTCRTTLSKSTSPVWTARSTTFGKASTSTMMVAQPSSVARFMAKAAVSGATGLSLHFTRSCRDSSRQAPLRVAMVDLSAMSRVRLYSTLRATLRTTPGCWQAPGSLATRQVCVTSTSRPLASNERL